MYYTKTNSPLGELTITSTKDKLTGVYLKNQRYFLHNIKEELVRNDNLDILKKTTSWLNDYFKGLKKDPSELPLNLRGTSFQKLVWQELLKIPYGKTTTYKELSIKIAKKLNKEKMSSQAIGGAVGHNPISIIIPCHRVIGSNGSLTGYAAGIDKKKYLLNLEQQKKA